MEAPVSPCPVPTEQQPLNEFNDLKESWFYRWATLAWPGYVQAMVWIWAFGGFLAGPVAAVSFPPHKDFGQFLLSTALGAAVFPVLALVRLYLGWRYIRDRLQKESVLYEESGWYDGQTWEKPTEVLARDRLIVTYQVQPLLQRLERTLGIFSLGFVLGGCIWIFI